MTAYLVTHPDGDKFVCEAQDGKIARDKVIERVKKEFGETWSSADLKVFAIRENPIMINNHTWMRKRTYVPTSK